MTCFYISWVKNFDFTVFYTSKVFLLSDLKDKAHQANLFKNKTMLQKENRPDEGLL